LIGNGELDLHTSKSLKKEVNDIGASGFHSLAYSVDIGLLQLLALNALLSMIKMSQVEEKLLFILMILNRYTLLSIT
jgi:energy-converting hydrogenase Eha subunit E